MRSNCYNLALKILSKREYSRLELTQKLLQKAFNKNEITQVIDKLIEKKYQSDKRFATEFVLMRVNQGKGKIIIELQLKQRGIDNFDFKDFNFFDLCKAVKIKKYGTEKTKDLKYKSKQIRFLQSRGFSFDEINQAI